MVERFSGRSELVQSECSRDPIEKRNSSAKIESNDIRCQFVLEFSEVRWSSAGVVLLILDLLMIDGQRHLIEDIKNDLQNKGAFIICIVHSLGDSFWCSFCLFIFHARTNCGILVLFAISI